jgi:hypothetical protein
MDNWFCRALLCIALAFGFILSATNNSHAVLSKPNGPFGLEPIDPFIPDQPINPTTPAETPLPGTETLLTPPTTTPPVSTPPTNGNTGIQPAAANNSAYKLQGDPANCGTVQPTAFSTAACPGVTPDSNQITVNNLADNPGYSKCVKINNTTSKTFFVPLRTFKEWDAFQKNAPAGVQIIDCSATPPTPTPVNGACGSATTGLGTATAPTNNLCNSGTPSSVSGNGPWNWTCAGSNGGTTASCTGNFRICGADSFKWVYFPLPGKKPFPTHKCMVGAVSSPVVGPTSNGFTIDQEYTWTCSLPDGRTQSCWMEIEHLCGKYKC